MPPKTETGLVKYDAMCHAIAECHRVDEVKDLRDKAKALECYAHQAMNLEAERQAAQVRIRAERRTGELLIETKENGTRHAGKGAIPKLPSGNARAKTTLADLKITWDQSSLWQQLAEVPTEDFEHALNTSGSVPSTEGIVNAHRLKQNPPPERVDPEALWFWGHLKDFERWDFETRDIKPLLAKMTQPMLDDCFRLIPQIAAWLEVPRGASKTATVGSRNKRA